MGILKIFLEIFQNLSKNVFTYGRIYVIIFLVK